MCSKLWRTIQLVNDCQNGEAFDDQMKDYMKRLRRSIDRSFDKTIESKNLMVFFENKLFIWQTDDQCLYCCRLKDETNIINIQCLILTNAPLFDVESLQLSGSGRYLALCGSRGINIVELPHKWGINSAYEASKVTVLSRSWPLAERLFVCNQNISLLCSLWHPASHLQQHITLLTNDNCLRIFDITEEQTPIQVINLSSNDSVNDTSVSLFALSLGDNAVSFDFGPPISKCYDVEPSAITIQDECLFPIYVLKGNGDVLLVYSSLKYSYVSKCVFGPLTMMPPAEDNYGVDACSLICLDCVPPVVVIATSSGVLHHCIALDNEDELCTDGSLLPQPTLYVYETIELSLSLTSNIESQDMSCTLRLHKDSIIPMRYYCSHACGIHAICVPFVSQLKSKDELNFKEEESIVEHMICTKPIASEDSEESTKSSIVPLGLAIGVQNGYTCLLVMLNSGELIGQRLTPTYIAHVLDEENIDDCSQTDSLAAISVPKVDFVEYIKHSLKRNTSVPLLKSKETISNQTSQNLELLLTTIDILKKEYIQKLDLASVAIERRVKVLINDKLIQLKELSRCMTQKDSLMKALVDFVEKYDKTRERQQLLSNRIDKVLEQLQYQRPQLSDAEISLREELKKVSNKLSSHRNKLEQIKVKCKYQEEQTANVIVDSPLTRTSAQTINSEAQRSPSFNQIKSIKEMLANEGELISELVQSLNNISKDLLE